MGRPAGGLGALTRDERYWAHVGWLDRHLHAFTSDQGVTRIQQIQRCGELALALRTRVLTEGSVDALGWLPWRDSLVAYLDRDSIRERSRAELPTAHAWLMPYVVLRSLDLWSDSWHDQTLRAAQRWGFPETLEVVPYRRADQLFFLQLLDPSRAPELRTAIDRTSLASGPSIIHADRDAAYSVTHTILYATSFGLVPVDASWPHLQAARHFVESALVRFTRRRDWDLVGELLICMKLLPGANRELAQESERQFASAVRPDGAILPSDATARALDAMDRIEPQADFDAVYHTTLVGLFLAASTPRSAPAASHRVWRTGPQRDIASPKLLAVAHLGRAEGVRTAPETEPEGVAKIGWDTTLRVDRLELAATLRSGPDPTNDPEVLIALATALAAERDYGALIGVLGWLVELGRWDELADACLELLLDHQLPDGRIGLLDARLSDADETTKAVVYSTLTDRFVGLCDRIEHARHGSDELLRAPAAAG
ncbi:DUF6895 family protein [Agromyces sp. M3QZ16-3]|uniref:DUF6895 family protein n=1 Tax=Agromyces sp. M3QZ16-3 TaxID=3447585 RepID=UPI003F690730